MQNLKTRFENDIKLEIQYTNENIKRLEENLKDIPSIIEQNRKHIQDLEELLQSVKSTTAAFDMTYITYGDDE